MAYSCLAYTLCTQTNNRSLAMHMGASKEPNANRLHGLDVKLQWIVVYIWNIIKVEFTTTRNLRAHILCEYYSLNTYSETPSACVWVCVCVSMCEWTRKLELVVMFFHRFGCFIPNQTHVSFRGHWPSVLRLFQYLWSMRRKCVKYVFPFIKVRRFEMHVMRTHAPWFNIFQFVQLMNFKLWRHEDIIIGFRRHKSSWVDRFYCGTRILQL